VTDSLQYAAQVASAISRRKTMAQPQGASASEQAYDAKTLAKKHRISVEEAAKIISEHGADRKASDKAARRIAA
jgi:hypothetical protein